MKPICKESMKVFVEMRDFLDSLKCPKAKELVKKFDDLKESFCKFDQTVDCGNKNCTCDPCKCILDCCCEPKMDSE